MIYPTLAETPGCNPACTACHYKDLSYPEQVARKEAWAHRQLGAWGEKLQNLREAPVNERLHYRTKSWLRSFAHPDGPLAFGMYRALKVDRKWESEFVDWSHCPLHHHAIERMLARFGTTLLTQAPGFARDRLMGVWAGIPHWVVVANMVEAHDLAVLKNLNWAEILEPPFTHPWFHHNPQVGRQVFSHHPFVSLFDGMAEAAETGGHEFAPVKAFRQVATTLLNEARALAVSHLLRETPPLVLDLYSGTGDLARLLPDEVDWIGVELARAAVRFSETRKPTHRRLHRAYVGTIEDRLSDPALQAELPEGLGLFVNPPRSGLGERALQQIMDLTVQRQARTLAYLSCSASSLSRDLRALETVGWKVERLQPYDFFPQTEHFETLALLVR